MVVESNTGQNTKVKGIVIWFCIIGALGGLLFGLDQGFINGSLEFIERYWHLSLSQGESYAGIMLIGSVIGALGSGWITRTVGRKFTLVIAAIFFTVFAFWGAVTHSFEVLYWTRLCIGLAVGSASFVVPLYLAEIAPTRIRGAMISMYQFFITIGILGIYCTNAFTGHVFGPTWGDASWRLMIGFIAIPAIIMFILVLTIPKTPRFLMLKKKEDKARKVLEKTLNSEEEINFELKEIKESLAQDAKIKTSGGWKMLGKSFFKRVLLLGIIVMALQQLTGINTVIYYSGNIFKAAGMANPAVGTILVGIINVLATIIALVLIDKFGRKKLLFSGYGVMFVTLAIIGSLFLAMPLGTFGQIVMVVAVLVFIVGFAYSWGPIAWVLCAELFPLEGRDFGMTITTAANWIVNWIVVRFSLSIMHDWSPTALFYIFAIFCIVGFIITKYFIPETKGVSLEELEMNLKNGKKLKDLGNVE
ncbi:MAG TPA: sugar porter family MFS transporter [Victivallales bacterium]|nr:sugar porter family MFS transporter [Victivallales bacterium]